jgi:hypothetical protein
MDAIKADCKTSYHASRHSGTRPLKDIHLIVMHDTEGGTAESVARYFAEAPKPDGEPGGSAHLVVDDNHCYRCLANEQVPWGAPGANEDGFHLQQCGYASWDAHEWGQHSNMLHRAAYKAAFHCHKFDIAPVFLTHDKISSRKGITTHAEVSKAFPKLGNHTDPGSGWPRALFMALVSHYYDELMPGV